MADPNWVDDAFRRIAVPRLPGSAAADDVEHAIARQLAAFGYTVERLPFAARGHRLYAVSVAGAGFGWVALGLGPLLALPFPWWSVMITGLTALAAVGLVAFGVARGYIGPVGQVVRTVNLQGTRGEALPRVWLVAHSDSKAQRVSLGGRVLAVLALAAGVLGLVVLLGARSAGPLPIWAILPCVGLATAGGAALTGRPVRDGSPGAVDNATGVVAVLTAAEALKDRTDVGVLITGAEELGMEGARVWVRETPQTGMFVNVDSVDARGRFNVLVHRPRALSAPGRRGAGSARLAGEVVGALHRAGQPVRRGLLPPGVFVDGAVLAGAGMPGVTLSRGDWQTLRVIHTQRDRPDRTDPQPAVIAGRAVAVAVTRLLG